MKKRSFFLLYLFLILILSGCGPGKYYLIQSNHTGLSSEDVFQSSGCLSSETIYPRDHVFKKIFDPSKDDLIYYTIGVLRGRIKNDFDLKTVWYDPRGIEFKSIKKHYSAYRVKHHPRYTGNIFTHKIRTSLLADKPGKWKVELYFDGELTRTGKFTILPTKMRWTVAVSSTPLGADVYLDGSYSGTTPMNIKLNKGSHNIRLEKDGYKTLKESLWVSNNRDYFCDLEREEIVDTEPPEIKISSPVNNLKTINEKIHLKGRITDNIKVSKLQVTRDNVVLHHDKDLLTFQEKTDNASINVSMLEKEVKLNTGRNDIMVEATDQAGNTARKFLAVYRTEPVAEKPPEIEKLVTLPKIGNYYAVVIGIGKYQDDRIPHLKYATVDAEEIYNILTDPQYGNFSENQVKLLIDEQATYRNIKSAIGTWLRRNTQKDDTVVIFFAGHGAPEDEKTYWVTYNANIDDLYGTALSNDEISDMLNRVEAKKMVALLDSCYSAATINRTDKKRSITIVKDPFIKFKGKGRVIITSSDGKEQSLELEKLGHGVFTYYLLKALKGKADENKDGFVELDEVWDYIKYRVTDTARKYGSTQTPIIDGSYSAGIVLSKHPERLKELYMKTEREKKEKELESNVATLTELYSEGEITSRQFDNAVKILESGEKNKLLDDFLSDKISLTTFKTVFK